jgi:hypothetical protein
LLLTLTSTIILMSDSRRTHDHILLFHIRDSPNLEGHVPVFIFTRDRVAQFYPQALGSLFLASYDSQGYGGGIRPRLHTGSESESESESELFYDWRFFLAPSPLRPKTSIFFQLNTCGYSPYVTSSLSKG